MSTLYQLATVVLLRIVVVTAQRLARSSPLLQSADPAAAAAQAGYRRLRHATLDAERQAVVGLRGQGVISDEMLHRLEQDLDVEAMGIGLGEVRMGSSYPRGRPE